jgi:hypothetical protein
MAKAIFATLGILAVLLLSLGISSAADSENNFTISITGAGSSSSNPLIGAVGDSIHFTVKFVNNNTIYPKVNLSWSGSDISSGTKDNVGDTTTFTPTIKIGSGHSHALKVEIKNSTGDVITTLTRSVYYTSLKNDTLCKLEGNGEKGDLEITDFDVNNKGAGKDDEWQYLDELEITVDVKNTNHDDSLRDIEVKIVILDNKMEEGGNDVTNDFDIKDEVITTIGKLKHRDKESVVFKIDELPSDLDDGTYYAYVMAYEDGNEDNQCASKSSKLDSDKYFKFTVESVDYEDSIIAKPSNQEQINTYCGQKNLEISIPIYNLGSDREDKVLVNLYNSELKIDEYVIIEDLKDGDKELATFNINIPTKLTKEKYKLETIVSFDWDDDKEENDPLSYDEETTDKSIVLNILGCKAVAPSITATLESKKQIGENLIIKTTIKNNGNEQEFLVAPTGYDTWADLVSVTPGKSTIASGSTQEVIIILTPKKAGPQTFTIQTIANGETYNQPISVKIAEKPGMFQFEMINTTLYLLAGIAVLLILIFLVIIIKLSKRSRKADF